MSSPMRRGLKQLPQHVIGRDTRLCLNEFPDEKGIETGCKLQSCIGESCCLNEFPDEKGIETLPPNRG